MPSRHYFKALMEITSDAFVATDSDLKIIESNEVWQIQTGKKSLDGSHLSQFVLPDDLDKVKNALLKEKLVIRVSSHETQSFEFFECLKNQTEDGFLVFSLRKVDELLKTKSFLKKMESVSGIGYWEIDLHTKKLFWSEQTHFIHETDPKTYQPKLEDGLSFYHPESIPVLTEAVNRMMSEGIGYDLKLKFITAKGRLRWVRAISGAQMDEG